MCLELVHDKRDQDGDGDGETDGDDNMSDVGDDMGDGGDAMSDGGDVSVGNGDGAIESPSLSDKDNHDATDSDDLLNKVGKRLREMPPAAFQHTALRSKGKKVGATKGDKSNAKKPLGHDGGQCCKPCGYQRACRNLGTRRFRKYLVRKYGAGTTPKLQTLYVPNKAAGRQHIFQTLTHK